MILRSIMKGKIDHFAYFLFPISYFLTPISYLLFSRIPLLAGRDLRCATTYFLFPVSYYSCSLPIDFPD